MQKKKRTMSEISGIPPPPPWEIDVDYSGPDLLHITPNYTIFSLASVCSFWYVGTKPSVCIIAVTVARPLFTMSARQLLLQNEIHCSLIISSLPGMCESVDLVLGL